MSQREQSEMDADPFASVPTCWTAIRLASKRNRTRFICELARQSNDDDDEYQPSALAGALDGEFIVVGMGATAEAAVSDAIERASRACRTPVLE